MKSIYLWMFLLFAIALGAVWQFYPLQDSSNRMTALPFAGARFVGKNVPLTPWEQDFFRNVNVDKRLYQINNQYYFISMLDGTQNRHVVHDPRFCFRGAGWHIQKEEAIKLPKGEANIVFLDKDKQTMEAMYWFTDGKSQFSSSLRYWWATTLRRLSLGKSGEEPILVIIQPIYNSHPDWTKIIQDFSTPV